MTRGSGKAALSSWGFRKFAASGLGLKGAVWLAKGGEGRKAPLVAVVQ
jgi:hypothetical protein